MRLPIDNILETKKLGFLKKLGTIPQVPPFLKILFGEKNDKALKNSGLIALFHAIIN